MRILGFDSMGTSQENIKKSPFHIVYELSKKLKDIEELTDEKLLVIFDEMAEEFASESYGYQYLPDFLIDYADSSQEKSPSKKRYPKNNIVLSGTFCSISR
ncbi:MAG: hypothetical protein GOP50_12375 [Candidatus Heimdallarchaeota archaeon]|nr:hypothetical protein [Candidatus Heimdallarchaeota archaeon]